MKEFKYSPKGEGWSGDVVIKVPTHAERLKIMKELNLAKLKSEVAEDQLDAAEAMLAQVKDRVVSMDVSYNGHKFADFEDLQYYQVGNELINEIGMVLMQGMSLGKSSP